MTVLVPCQLRAQLRAFALAAAVCLSSQSGDAGLESAAPPDPGSNGQPGGSSSWGPSPIYDRRQMTGEWTGLVPGNNALVTLRVGKAGRGVAAITKTEEPEVVTRIYSFTDLQVQEGEFKLASADRQFEITGSANRDLGILGEGRATLTIREPDRLDQQFEMDLFYQSDASWIDQMLSLDQMRKPDSSPDQREPMGPQ